MPQARFIDTAGNETVGVSELDDETGEWLFMASSELREGGKGRLVEESTETSVRLLLRVHVHGEAYGEPLNSFAYAVDPMTSSN